MTKFKLILIAGCTLVSSHGFAQQYVPPPPSHPSSGGTNTTINPPRPSKPIPGTHIDAPNAPRIDFKNGATVFIYRDEIVLREPNGHKRTRKLPLPDMARNPFGCKYLKNYLDTTSPYTQNWRDNCAVYLKHCWGLNW